MTEARSSLYGLTVRELEQFLAIHAELLHDVTIRTHRAALALYATLLLRPDCFRTPVEVKAWAWAQQRGVRRESVTEALHMLVARGYLEDHPRMAPRDPRRVTVRLARSVPERTYESPARAASA